MLVLVLRFGQNHLIVIAEHRAPQNISAITLLSLGSIKGLCRQRGYRGHFLFKLLVLLFYIIAFLSTKYTPLLYQFYRYP